MITIDEALTQKLAQMARLTLTDKETSLFTSQIHQIISYMETLTSLEDTQATDTTTPITVVSLREDRVHCEDADATLACAPDLLDNGFRVPQILT